MSVNRRNFMKYAAALPAVGTAMTRGDSVMAAMRAPVTRKSVPAGWVDLQVNGAMRMAFKGSNMNADTVLRIMEYVLKSGTGVFLPTISTANLVTYQRNIPIIREAVEREGLQQHIPGLHLEGPFLSAEPGAIGAHNPSLVQPASVEFYDKMVGEHGDFIRIVTVAAESPGVVELIAELKNRRVSVALGHQLPTREQLQVAVKAGATLATHVGNGLPNLIHRHHNPIWPILADDSLTAMIITDGHHLPGDMIKTIVRTKGVEKIIVTSDASSLAGMSPGQYGSVVIEENGLCHHPKNKHLCGSTAMMSNCMEFLKNQGLLTELELQAVGRYNPLQVLGLG